MSEFKIFVVEDDPWYGEMLKYHLTLTPEYEVELFDNPKSCLGNLYLKPDVICVDYYLADNNGGELFEQIKSRNPNIPVIIISGQDDISIVLDLLKKGIYDYIIKDDNTKDLLRNTLKNLRETSNLKKEVETLKESLEAKYDFQNTIIGQSKKIKESFDLIETAAKTNINVSVTGETGTGKELVAKAIHYRSSRKKKPFIALNMAAIPKELVESELFGHEKGSFTGAIARKIGKFEEADGGTIFLDEIAELDLNMQVKLLRVIQEREVVRVGGNKSIKFNAHLISATNKNLAEEVKKQTFRKDLYYRMIGLPIELPPLRERGNDVIILSNHFIKMFSKENGFKAPVLNDKAKEMLLRYNYPGNVRELKSIVELACVMCKNGEISESNLNFHTQIIDEDSFSSMEKTLKEYTVDIVSFFLKKYNNNVVEVAQKLDIGKSTIYNLIKSGDLSK